MHLLVSLAALWLSSPYTVVAAALGDDPSQWYKKYPSYPPYCSTPEQMKARSVPPLRENSTDPKALKTQLVHVTAIIRHGARTPWDYYDCWDGYHDNPETNSWDCDGLYSYTSPPPPSDIETSDTNNNTKKEKKDAMFLFEKHYDALNNDKNANSNLTNVLHGTCLVGQLIAQGYPQEYENGQTIRDAYVFDGKDKNHSDHDPRLRLLDLTHPHEGEDSPYQEPTLYFRADDDERTTMSGQILLRGLFGSEFVQHLEKHGHQPIIRLHTADRKRDIVGPNNDFCPRLVELQQEAEQSEEYQSFNSSSEAALLRKFQQEHLKSDLSAGVTLDCLMTTMCTDRPLPEAIDDYEQPDKSIDPDTYGRNLFQRIMDFNVRSYAIKTKYQEAAYSKLAMGPLWAEILEFILPVVNADTSDSFIGHTPASNKLALFSGHDTTIMPLLATLGPDVWNGKDWTPYASLLLIEIHEIVGGTRDNSIYSSDYVFRLIYNGEVLTDKVPGCPAEKDLCDTKILVQRVEPFATRLVDCAPRNATLSPISSPTSSPSSSSCTDVDTETTSVVEQSESVLASPGGWLIVVGLSLASAIFGGLVMRVYMTRSFRYRKATHGIGGDADGLSLREVTAGSESYQHPPAERADNLSTPTIA